MRLRVTVLTLVKDPPMSTLPSDWVATAYTCAPAEVVPQYTASASEPSAFRRAM